jgi:UDP-N-acetylglucosamine--N-acetylmuramyl-(pentapeptide) pyrophosphoryl-undecaprenol N-acetylglucosamine transferase
LQKLDKTYRFIISGGGTGGHIYPAIAIANALRALNPENEILFVGAEGRMEMEKVPQAGYKIEGLWISGLQRSFTLDNLSFPIKVVSSLLKAKSIIKNFKPDAVIGVGGYASGPVLYMAQKAGIPTVIQEQNSYAGITNKILAKNAKKICVAYNNMESFFPANVIEITGNPVRKDIDFLEAKQGEAFKYFGLSSEKITLLAIGGSLGARTINESLAAKLDLLVENNIQLVWQTGKNFAERVNELKPKYESKGIHITEFINRMDLAYSVADIVISRAGALSIAELCNTGKACILVPSPNVAEDHQTKNAMALVNENAAIMVKDTDAKTELVSKAIELIKNNDLKTELSNNIKKLAKPDAAENIANIIMEVVK